MTQSAGEWMRANGHQWKKKPSPRSKARDKIRKEPLGPGAVGSARRRRLKEKHLVGGVYHTNETVKEFVERHRDAQSSECIFVPAARAGVPACVSFMGKNIAAARYMALLTHGTPKWKHAFATHKCGNGHLSCINPAHIEWGDPSTNTGDANTHRQALDTDERVAAIDEQRSKGD